MRIKQKNYSVISSKRRKGAVAGAGNGKQQQFGVFEFFLERERLLSSFSANPTVGIRRDKKQSCSTHRGLCVGLSFVSF